MKKPGGLKHKLSTGWVLCGVHCALPAHAIPVSSAHPHLPAPYTTRGLPLLAPAPAAAAGPEPPQQHPPAASSVNGSAAGPTCDGGASSLPAALPRLGLTPLLTSPPTWVCSLSPSSSSPGSSVLKAAPALQPGWGVSGSSYSLAWVVPAGAAGQQCGSKAASEMTSSTKLGWSVSGRVVRLSLLKAYRGSRAASMP